MPPERMDREPQDHGLRDVADRAARDLATRLGVPVVEIEVLEARAVVWPDAGAGCPVPGMRFKQVPVDGALIRLRAGDRVYEYHSGGRRGLSLCEPAPGTAPPDAAAPGDEAPPRTAPPPDAERPASN